MASDARSSHAFRRHNAHSGPSARRHEARQVSEDCRPAEPKCELHVVPDDLVLAVRRLADFGKRATVPIAKRRAATTCTRRFPMKSLATWCRVRSLLM